MPFKRGRKHANRSCYHTGMIRSFRDNETEKLFRRERIRRLPPDAQRTALRKLAQLDAAAQERIGREVHVLRRDAA